MKAEITLTAMQEAALERYCRITHTTREDVIQQALLCFLPNCTASKPLRLGEYVGFGIWRNKPVDALAYQHRLRSEWPE